MRKKELAEKILHRLETQRFADWYNEGGKFDTYITVEFPKGHPKHFTKEMILEAIEQMFLADLPPERD